MPFELWTCFVYSDVYSLCVAYPEPLADRLYGETKQYLIDHVAQLLNKVQEDGEQNLVKNYFHYWSQVCFELIRLTKVMVFYFF